MILLLLSVFSLLSLGYDPEPEAEVLVQVTDFEFGAKTQSPTPEVVKEPDYYGYDWCFDNYEEDECFEYYYYGYTWCLEKYSEDECYNYYYGSTEDEDWGADDSYKWCTNFYDEEYCSFAYLGNQPVDWDWLSFGYHNCLEAIADDEYCFDQYYGYSWCLNHYDDLECYEYYYGGEDWLWEDDTSYNSYWSYIWCIYSYSDDDCTERYPTDGTPTSPSTGNIMFFVVVSGFVLAALVWMSWNKCSCFKPKERLEQTEDGKHEKFICSVPKDQDNRQVPTVGGEDKVEII